MPPSPAKRFADRVPILTSITNSIQESIPAEVKRKLRSWNKSLSKRGSQAFTKHGTHSGSASGKARRAANRRFSVTEDLVSVRKSVAEEAQARQQQKKSKQRPVANTIKRRPRGSYAALRGSASASELRANLSDSAANFTDRVKRTSSDFRASFTSLRHTSSSTNLGKRVRSSTGSATQPSPREYALEFAGPSSRRASAATPDLSRSASANKLASSVRGSVKRLRRSASNLSLRKKLARNEQVDQQRPSPDSPNEVQRSFSLIEFLHPDQYLDARERLLSIAEHDEDGFRQDPIFAFHESRTCQSGPSPAFVKKLPFRTASSSAYRRDSVIDMDGTERSFSTGPRRSSSLQHQRYSSVSVKMMNQINRSNGLRDIRDHINEIRLLHQVAALAFHQSLCAQASIIATLYEIEYGEDGHGWGTNLQKSLDTVELVGPPGGVAGKVTAKMWADESRILEAVTDSRWRAIGISRTEEEQRWVVVLSE